MGTLKREKTIRCFNGCSMSGCPTHKYRVEYQNTADVLTIYKDDQIVAGFEPPEWEALLEMVKSLDTPFFEV
jgi:hypothetical protein